MKIAIYFNLPAGGAKRYIYEEVRRLSEKHLIDVYTLSASDREFCNLEPYSKNTFVYNYDYLKLFKFPLSRLNWILQIKDVLMMERLLKKVAIDIDKRNYDIVLTNTCICTEIPLLMKYLETPVIYFAHSINFKSIVKREECNLKLYRRIMRKIFPDYGQILYRYILRRKKKENIENANLILTVSKFLKEQLKIYYKISAEVNYPGVDLKRFVPDPGIEKQDLVVSAGNLRPNKGYDFIIESVGLIEEKIRPCVGIAYNEGSEEEKNYLIGLANIKQVKLKFFKDQNIVEIYNNAKIIVVTSFNEGLGLVALEAMACGVPVLGVNEGGIQETILNEKTGFVLERNQEKFAEKIQYFIENEKIAKEYGQNGRNYVTENWSWEKSSREMEKYFYEVIRSK